jgi:hypothetical protein
MSVIHNIDWYFTGLTLTSRHAGCFPRLHFWKGIVMNTRFNALKFSQAPSAAQASGSAQPSRVRRFGAAAWQFLQAIGRARARREMLALADRWQSERPELAAQLRAASLDSGCV